MRNSNKTFYSKKSFNEEDFIQITIPSGAYELESLNDEFQRNLIDKCHYTEAENPFTIKPNFSTLGSVIEINPQGANSVLCLMIVLEIYLDFVRLCYSKK